MLSSAYCAFTTTRPCWWNLSLKFRGKIYKFPHTGAASPDSASSDPIMLNIHESNLTLELDAVEWLTSRLDRFNLEKELLHPLTRLVGRIQSRSGRPE